MRIASMQFHATMNTALQKASVAVDGLMQKMASGQRLQLPSEDPVTHVRLARLAREDAALTQYRDNIGALLSRLQQNESILDGMSTDLQQARDLLVWAADGGNSGADVNAMASSLKSLRDSLFYSVNIRDHEGRSLFSGTAVDAAAVSFDSAAAPGSRYAFTGNTELQKVVVGNGITEAANVSLPEIATLLNRLDEAIAVLETPAVNINDPAARSLLVAGLNGIDAALESVGGRIAALGGAQNILGTLDDNHANVSLSNRQAMLTLGQLDYGDATVQLNAYTIAMQATQKAYAKVSVLSLFQVL